MPGNDDCDCYSRLPLTRLASNIFRLQNAFFT